MGLQFDVDKFPGLAEPRVCICHGNWVECPLCHGTGKPCEKCGGLQSYIKGDSFVAKCSCAELEEEERVRLSSGLLPGMEEWTFDRGIWNGDGASRLKEIADRVRDWVRVPKGWLLFQAPSGRGKSYLLACLVNAAGVWNCEAVYFMTSMLLEQVQERRLYPERFTDFSFPAWWRRLQEVGLLVLDEFGNFNLTAAREEKLRELLIYRSDPVFKPTVIASDQDFSLLADRYPWLVSRLHHRANRKVDFSGVPDLRRQR